MYCPDLVYISGPCHGMTHDRTMLDVPWSAGQTLGDVETLASTLLYSTSDYVEGYSEPRIGMTSNYLFTLSKASSSARTLLIRADAATLAQETYDPELAGSHFLINFTIVDEDTIYTIEEAYPGETDKLQLCRVTFNGGTPNREVIYEVDCWPGEYSGSPYLSWDTVSLLYFKNGSKNYIVYTGTWMADDYPETCPNEVMLRFWIYDIDLNSMSDQWVVPAPDAGYSYDLYEVTWNCTPPAFYGSKMIITVGLGSMSTYDPHYYDDPPVQRPWATTIFVDVSTSEITQVYDWTDSDWEWNWLYEVGGVIDHDTDTYYYQMWLEDDAHSNLNSGYFLFSIDLAGTPSQTKGAEAGTPDGRGCHYFQGISKCYAVDREPTVPTALDVFELPSMTPITTINVDYSQWNGHYFESGIAIDRTQNMLWSLRSGILEGKSLNGGTDRDITISGSLPFTYSNNRAIHYRILSDMALVMVSSSRSSPSLGQVDYYLLKEA
jgi:hypothetical protein